jgi:hypothetical protein
LHDMDNVNVVFEMFDKGVASLHDGKV